MKISGLEKGALVLTLAFLLFAAGYFLGQNSGAEPYTVAAQTQWTSPVGAAETAESARTAAQSQLPAAEPSPAATETAEPPAVETSEPPAAGESGKVNINTADAAVLDTLPGIGPKRAADIVADREANGPFRIPEDITRVSGIGEGILARIIDHITVG